MKLNRDTWVLLLVWALGTIININKAYHIDDSFHLESAQWIWQHPSQPMSGQINWYDNPEDMHHFNQPPLLFYIIALVGGLFGYSEPVLHLIIAGFSLLSLVYFKKLLGHIDIKNKAFFMVLLALSPAFIINQNLMTDIPILSLELGFLYHFVQEENRRKHLMYAMLFLSGALLIKYSMMPLLVATALMIILKKEYKNLVYCLIPIAALLLWTLWNKLEYGGVHIQDRPKNDINIKMVYEQIIALFSCIGAILPIPVIIWSGLMKRRTTVLLNVVGLLFFGALVLATLSEILSIDLSNFVLNQLFIAIGSFVVFGVLASVASRLLPMLKDGRIRWDLNYISLVVMLGGMTVFLLLYAPFMATRHVLLLMPFMLILLSPVFQMASKASLVLAAVVVGSLGVLLGLSDWRYADTYRQMAKVEFDHQHQKVWTIGHWGWQWYAKQRGFDFYSKDSSLPKIGEYLVFPRHISKQVLDSSDQIEEVQAVIYPCKDLSFIAVNGFASLYNSYYNKPAWEFSLAPMDTLVIGRFIAVKDSVYSK